MFDISIAFKFVDSDNFGKNQTPLHRNGMADIPKISPLLDLLYGENQVTNSVDYSQHPNTATGIFSVHNSNGGLFWQPCSRAHVFPLARKITNISP